VGLTAPDDFNVRVALADDADGAPVRRLAELQGSPPPQGLVAIADIGGEPVAAVAFADGRAVADPERSSPAIIALLQMHRWALRAIVTVWGA
jgi:hypothetical protein